MMNFFSFTLLLCFVSQFSPASSGTWASQNVDIFTDFPENQPKLKIAQEAATTQVDPDFKFEEVSSVKTTTTEPLQYQISHKFVQEQPNKYNIKYIDIILEEKNASWVPVSFKYTTKSQLKPIKPKKGNGAAVTQPVIPQSQSSYMAYPPPAMVSPYMTPTTDGTQPLVEALVEDDP